MPRPSSSTSTEPSTWMRTSILRAWPARASSTELSTTSQMRWCSPRTSVSPMYMAGRMRTASRPSRIVMDSAPYSPWVGALSGRVDSRMLSVMGGSAIQLEDDLPDARLAQGGVRARADGLAVVALELGQVHRGSHLDHQLSAAEGRRCGALAPRLAGRVRPGPEHALVAARATEAALLQELAQDAGDGLGSARFVALQLQESIVIGITT